MPRGVCCSEHRVQAKWITANSCHHPGPHQTSFPAERMIPSWVRFGAAHTEDGQALELGASAGKDGCATAPPAASAGLCTHRREALPSPHLLPAQPQEEEPATWGPQTDPRGVDTGVAHQPQHQAEDQAAAEHPCSAAVYHRMSTTGMRSKVLGNLLQAKGSHRGKFHPRKPCFRPRTTDRAVSVTCRQAA